MSNSVQDRSGQSMLPKAERRALGKIAAAKRAKAKRRKLLLHAMTRLSFPVLAVAVVVGLGLVGHRGRSPTAPPRRRPGRAVATPPPRAPRCRPTPTRRCRPSRP